MENHRITEHKAKRHYGLVLERLDDGRVRWLDTRDPHQGGPTYPNPGTALTALQRWIDFGMAKKLT